MIITHCIAEHFHSNGRNITLHSVILSQMKVNIVAREYLSTILHIKQWNKVKECKQMVHPWFLVPDDIKYGCSSKCWDKITLGSGVLDSFEQFVFFYEFTYVFSIGKKSMLAGNTTITH